MLVRITHPVTGGVSHVPESTVESWRKSGWQTEADQRPARKIAGARASVETVPEGTNTTPNKED